ncbi:nucleotide exchange factor GrpE [Solicola gregarius]|uniref:Protein GrpE n=1 Tax=Solicola gregarius TaxID=2908642 RepID=A0AA46TKP4_9ACTN|nr:nucleotide exchange factor GrpE [Solicola gregarius]UYM07056.1 nucleotide exchange factor GrpE [Solicola gregarius]
MTQPGPEQTPEESAGAEAPPDPGHDAAPAEGVEPEAPAPEPEPPSVEQQLAERTADLQRLQAEYVNYKRRVDRDRKADHERAVARVITQLLPVLDDIDRAREHDELDGGFKAVAESIEQVTRSFGLEAFGAEGEPFDPMIHEALHLEHSEDATEPSVSKVVQLGYRIGDGVLRPARVLVVAPQE